MKPQDILPDDKDGAVFKGVTVRKGTVGAFLANARILADADATPRAREQARADAIALLPAMRALGVFEVFSPRDAELAALVDTGR
jgi:hypothetical protein